MRARPVNEEQEEMAQLPRVAAPATSAVSTSQSRAVVSGRVASVVSTSVEQAGISTSTQFDTSAFAYQEQHRDAANDDHRQPSHKRQHFGLLNASSDSFAAILQSANGEIETDQSGNPVTRTFAGSVSKAIGIYELNSKIISGTNPVRGTEISLTL